MAAQTEDEIRSWERVDLGWVLCCPFGTKSETQNHRLRPLLRKHGFTDGWIIVWCRRRATGQWDWYSDQRLAETDEALPLVEAMCWGLEELASIANIRTMTYAQQEHTIMLELLRIRGNRKETK